VSGDAAHRPEARSTPSEYHTPGHVAVEVIIDIAQWISK